MHPARVIHRLPPGRRLRAHAPLLGLLDLLSSCFGAAGHACQLPGALCAPSVGVQLPCTSCWPLEHTQQRDGHGSPAATGQLPLSCAAPLCWRPAALLDLSAPSFAGQGDGDEVTGVQADGRQVVICGFGELGQSIANMLENPLSVSLGRGKVPYVAFDLQVRLLQALTAL